MASEAQFRHEDVSAVPRGYKVRTVSHPSGHQVRVAYPPGPRHKGSGKLVSILHPRGENPRTCANQGVVALLLATPIEELMAAKALAPGNGNPRHLLKTFTAYDLATKYAAEFSYNHPSKATSVEQDSSGYWRVYDHGKKSGNPKSKTREQVGKMQEKAVHFLKYVAKDKAKADEIEGMSVAEYAEKKGVTIENPKGRSQKQEARSQKKNVKRKKNQAQTEAAAALYEIFHGKKPKEIVELHQDVIRREDYAALGQLIEITLPDLNLAMDFEGDKVLLAASPNGKQMYVIGGNQDVRALLGKLADDEKDFLDLGQVGAVVYRTRKDFDKFEEIDYKHKMGEGGHEKPRLMYDKLNRQLYFVGGEYDASRHEGIVH